MNVNIIKCFFMDIVLLKNLICISNYNINEVNMAIYYNILDKQHYTRQTTFKPGPFD